MKNTPALSRFNKLVADISRLYEDARMAQVRFAWETGRRIVEEEQNGTVRAQYGTKLIESLSGELAKKYGTGFSPRNLAHMRRFYIEHKILQPAAKSTWANQIELMRVADPKLRKDLETRAVKEGLVRDDLRAIIREKTQGGTHAKQRGALTPPPKKQPPLQRPTGLVLDTYKLAGDEIDCGFFISYPATAQERHTVTVTNTPSFTYRATVERVVDGDTLLAAIDVGFGIKLHDKLRLRGIDCSELKTPQGESAKRFVQRVLPVGSVIVIKSRKTTVDTYGRFVMDVFYLRPDTTPDAIIESGTYLNQELLDTGHAVRMAE